MNVLKIKLVPIVITILYLISCRNYSDNENIRVINVGDINKTDKIVLEDVSSVDFIQLQMQDTINYIGAIKKIIYNDSCYCISDGKKIIFYNNEGKYKFTFDKLGRSGEEYLQIYDFEINNEEIYILDKNLSKILTYNMDDDLTYKSSLKLDFYPKSLKIISDSFMVINAENNIIDDEIKMKFHVFDMNENKIINSFYPLNIYKGKYLKYLWNSNFTNHNDSLFYYEPNDNTILFLNEKGYSNYLKIDFSANEPPPSFYNVNYENVMEFMNEFNDKKYASGIYWSIWTEDKFIFQFIHDKQLKIGIHNLGDNTTKIGGNFVVMNDVQLENYFISNNRLISYIYPEQLGKNSNSVMNRNGEIILVIAKF